MDSMDEEGQKDMAACCSDRDTENGDKQFFFIESQSSREASGVF